MKIEPTNSSAQYYLTESKKRLKEQEISNMLRITQNAYQKGNFEECIRQSKKVLSLDPNNDKAEEYLNLASLKIASKQIKAIVSQYVQSIKDKSLSIFYKKTCSSDLYQEKREDAELLFKLYDNIKIAVSNISIQFKDISQADVSFSRMLTGISRSDEKRQVLSEGTVKWNMKKQGNRWKIIEISYYSQRKK